MARSFVDVTKRIIAALPDEHTHDFDAVLRSAEYKAPEAEIDLWNEMSAILNDIVGQPPIEDGWRVSAVAILMDRPEEEIRANFVRKA